MLTYLSPLGPRLHLWFILESLGDNQTYVEKVMLSVYQLRREEIITTHKRVICYLNILLNTFIINVISQLVRI